MSRLLLASNNGKKLAELRRILGDAVTVIGLAEATNYVPGPETGATFADNAIAKAVEACQHTGEISLADDSGLTVQALNDMPGVLSARWAGRHGDNQANNDLLLAQLADVPDQRRGAAFVCALALAAPGQDPILVQGRWPGRIAREPRGRNGFGYDPLFVPAESDSDRTGRHSAELQPEEKDVLSHRGRALALMLPHLRALLG